MVSDAGRDGLLVCVIAGAHQRATGGVCETHALCLLCQGIELFGTGVAQHREITRTRLQMLSDVSLCDTRTRIQLGLTNAGRLRRLDRDTAGLRDTALCCTDSAGNAGGRRRSVGMHGVQSTAHGSVR